jgi:adenylate cyclase
MEQAPSNETSKTEIERKFLVSEFPPISNEVRSEKIYQGYLIKRDDYSIRIRQKGDRYYWTYKEALAEHAALRTEIEKEITREEFEALWPATAGKRLEKTRYMIRYGSTVVELDVFEGENAGNMLAEVEFNTTNDADNFDPFIPDWFGREVTSDPRYSNAHIAEHGFPATE